MRMIVSAWAMQDTDAASLWLSQQGSSPDTLPAHAALAQRIAEKDPHAGIEHAAILLDGRLLESTLESIISEWATHSIGEAAAFINANPLDWPPERRGRLYQLALTVPTPQL